MSKPSFQPWHLLTLAILLYVGLRVPYLQHDFFNVDEAVSAIVAHAILDGGLPYVDAVDHRGPLTYAFYALIFRVFGRWDMLPIQGVYTGLHVLLMLLMFRLGLRLDRAWTGAWAAMLYGTSAWLGAYFEIWPAHTEWLLTLCSVLGYVAYGVAPGRPGHLTGLRGLVLVGIGVLFGLGFLSKQLGALEAGGIGLYLLLELGLRQGQWADLMAEVGLMLLGWLLPLFFTLGIYARADALADFWLYFWTYNLTYYVGPQDLLARLEYSLKLFPAFLINKVLLASMLAGAFWLFPWQEARPSRPTPLGWHWLLPGWLLATSLEALIGGRAFEHYLIPTLAPMCLLAAWVLMRWADWLLHSPRSIQQAGKAALALALLLPLLQHWHHNKPLRQPQITTIEFEQMAAYLQTHTQPDEHIFVWGFSPEIYLLAERRPCCRFNFITIPLGLAPGVALDTAAARRNQVPGAWEALRADWQAHPPSYVVDATLFGNMQTYFEAYPPERYPIHQWLKKDYMLDTAFTSAPNFPYRVWQRKPEKDSLPVIE